MPVINLDERALYYELCGPNDAPPVVLSNSIGTTLEMWDGPCAALRQRYRVLRYDTRGHGRSALVEQSTTIDDLADDLAGLLDALDIPTAHVVGLSLGGMTAQAFTTRYPDRVRSLALLATACHLTEPGRWNRRIEAVLQGGMQALVEETMNRWFTPGFAQRDPQRLAEVRNRFSAIDPKGYAACCAAIRDMDLRDRITSIEGPTLVMVGAEDSATTVAHAEEIRSRISNAEMLILPRAAHLLSVECPNLVMAHLLPFLNRFS